MTTVYWSPWYINHDLYVENYLAHHELENVYSELVEFKNKSNIEDNFFNCHAFKGLTKNLYSLKNPYSVDLIFQNGQCISKHPPKVGYDLSMTSSAKSPSMINSLTINYCVNWIFFADKPVILQSYQPWMHKTYAYNNAFYVPGTFDISQWFRPLEAAIQLFQGENTFKSVEFEPLIYVNLLSEEPIKLKKFYLTENLIKHTKSCTKLKYYKSFKSLSNLYKVFKSSRLKNKILSEIQANVMD